MDWQALLVPIALLALCPLVCVELAKTIRWATLFGRDRPPFSRALRAEVAGQLTNALAPLRAGDVLRLGLVRAEGSRLVPATTAFVAAKAVDAVCLAALGVAVLGAVVLDHMSWALVGGAVVLGLGVGMAALGPCFNRFIPDTGRWQPWGMRLSAMLEAVEALRSERTWLMVGFTTAVVWVGGLAANAVVLAAVGVPPTIDLAARMLVAGYVVGLVPAPPARLGVFEAGISVSLTSAGIALPEAIAVAVVLHACQFAELGLLMVFSLAARRWSWSV